MKTTLSKNRTTRDSRDYEFLREEGQKYIEALSRKLWTDYNSHDPGITILEVLCYAITDLGNRIHLPIRDLLTLSDGHSSSLQGDFPTPKQILTTGPVSANDYRKLFVDIEGVKNAFLRVNQKQQMYVHCLQREEPSKDFPRGKLSYLEHIPDYENKSFFVLKGLNEVLFEPTWELQFLEEPERGDRLEKIKSCLEKRYHANRNLCEDLIEIREVDYLKLLVCGDILLEPFANATDTLVEILFRIQEYLAPSIPRYSLNDLLEEGIPVEAIFEGPKLNNGFIKTDELEKADVKTEVHLSDLVQIVMETPGVSQIKKLRMASCKKEEEDSVLEKKEKWTLCFHNDTKKVLRLCLDRTIETTNLFKDVISVDVQTEIVKDKLKQRILLHQKNLHLSCEDILPQPGKDLEIGHYETLQNDLPQVYGTDEYGLSPSLPEEHLAKALQLKSYLLFFDQVLATYFVHIRKIGQLLSAETTEQTYFESPVEGVKDFDKLVSIPENYGEEVKALLSQFDDYHNRKSTFLDHLLARFAENMNNYVFAMLDDFGEDITQVTIWHKATLLKEYPQMSYRRAASFNYFGTDQGVWDTHNVSGLKHRLCRLLGIRDYARQNLTDKDYEIYQELDVDNISEWRWRVFDQNKDIILSSSKHYHQKLEAETEMWEALSLAKNKVNYQVNPTADREQYYYNIVDKTGEVVARRIKYFNSKEVLEIAIKQSVDYLGGHLSNEGMFLIEHILFRPDRDTEKEEIYMKICMDPDCGFCCPADPYSLRLSIVLPGWTERFANPYFREYAEKIIRSEVPTHILCRVCWIGNLKESEPGKEPAEMGQMEKFESLYRAWLKEKMKHPKEQNEGVLKELLTLLHDLETVYPTGRLYDCSVAAEGESKSALVLGRTKIGNLKTKKDEEDQ